MLTTRREESKSIYSEQPGSSIALLERKAPVSYREYTEEMPRGETPEEAKIRMENNLKKLLNYDRYTEAGFTEEAEVCENSMVVEAVSEAVEEKSFSDEDLMPTSTTLQFGDGEVDKVFGDMQRQKEEQKNTYKLNGKGKLVLMLYTLAVTVILALIVLNTGVLTSLQGERMAKQEMVSSLFAEVEALEEKNAFFSTEEYVAPLAEELGMVKGN